jgi:hypothetical protein
MPVAQEVIGKADTRRNGSPPGRPKLTNRTLRGDQNLAIRDLLKDVRPGAIIKIRVKALVVVVLHAIVFVAQAVIQS